MFRNKKLFILFTFIIGQLSIRSQSVEEVADYSTFVDRQYDSPPMTVDPFPSHHSLKDLSVYAPNINGASVAVKDSVASVCDSSKTLIPSSR